MPKSAFQNPKSYIFAFLIKRIPMSLIRIVKMTFKEESITEFQRIFDERKERIAAAPGCSSVELLHDDRNIFFTYSLWEDEIALEDYRASELFTSTWALVRPLFKHKAEAWSVRKVV